MEKVKLSYESKWAEEMRSKGEGAEERAEPSYRAHIL